MLIAYMKVIEKDVTYHHYLMIKIMNLRIINQTNLDSVLVNRNRNSNNDLAHKKYVDDSLETEMFADLIKR